MNEHKLPLKFIVYLLFGSYSIGFPNISLNYPPRANIIAYPEHVSHLWLKAPLYINVSIFPLATNAILIPDPPKRWISALLTVAISLIVWTVYLLSLTTILCGMFSWGLWRVIQLFFSKDENALERDLIPNNT